MHAQMTAKTTFKAIVCFESLDDVGLNKIESVSPFLKGAFTDDRKAETTLPLGTNTSFSVVS
jgi:hypothetical protein